MQDEQAPAYGIFASALDAGYTNAQAARLELLISEEIGTARLQVATLRAIVQHDLEARSCVGL